MRKGWFLAMAMFGLFSVSSTYAQTDSVKIKVKRNKYKKVVKASPRTTPAATTVNVNTTPAAQTTTTTTTSKPAARQTSVATKSSATSSRVVHKTTTKRSAAPKR
ncbi:hypothetical protein [Mucilaginibacter lacusdianchii]|uniref:hypothetical protein n=1 Tax=Mucilaginibacter lacusdianchii TaxID=2684211 RepID=UPI00131C9BA2|nr:hypothetical protein [Mucilaginibacter sp. JXJ CY 39]